MILVPVIPDMKLGGERPVRSMQFFQHNGVAGQTGCILLRAESFDHSLPLHLDVREVTPRAIGRPAAATFALSPRSRHERGAGRGDDGEWITLQLPQQREDLWQPCGVGSRAFPRPASTGYRWPCGGVGCVNPIHSSVPRASASLMRMRGEERMAGSRSPNLLAEYLPHIQIRREENDRIDSGT